MTTRALFRSADAAIRRRRPAYGDASASMEALAKRWSVTLGHPITPEQVVLCMIDLKLTRLSHNPRHRNSAVDLAAYVALLQEVLR